MKSDARVKYTRMVIRKNFLDLLKEKPISKITVKEICERSEINRATFYKHYQDPFDLFKKLEDELLGQHRKMLSEKSYMDITTLYIDMLNVLKENREQYQILASSHGDHNLYNRIFEDCYQQVFPLIGRKFSNLDNVKQNLLYYYISQGCSGAVSYWFTSGMKESPEEIAEFISRATFSVVKAFAEDFPLPLPPKV